MGEVLVGLKAVTEEDVAKALGLQLDLPYLQRIFVDEVDPELVKKVPINFAKQAKIIPLSLQKDDTIAIAVADPLDTAAMDHARMLLGANLDTRIALASTIVDAINSVYDRSINEAEQLVDEMEATDLDSLAHELEEPKDLLDTDDEAPIIRLVNSLLFRAAKERASDIHIEPMESELLVRFRVDGVLQEVIKPPKRFQNSIVSRVKIMGQLNIAEKRLPQDGRIRIKIAGSDIDIRVSTIPTVVRRAHRHASARQDRDAARPGRARHGRSTTLERDGRASSSARTGSSSSPAPPAPARRPRSTARSRTHQHAGPQHPHRRGPGRVPARGHQPDAVNPKIGLTFADALRAFLRQDPDVIMVGEIRDKETAEIAIQASLTGHLVLLHRPHQRRRGRRHPPGRHGRRAVPRGLVADRHPGAAPGAPRVPGLPRAVHAHRRRAEGAEPLTAPRSSSATAWRSIYKADGLRRLQPQRLPRPHRHLRVAAGGRRRAPAGAQERGRRHHQEGRHRQGHATLLEDGARKVALGETTIAEVLSVTQEDI